MYRNFRGGGLDAEVCQEWCDSLMGSLVMHYESRVKYEQNRIHAAAIYCSDGRLNEHFDDFLQNGLNLPRYDRVALPGGPACLAGHPEAHLEEQGVVDELCEAGEGPAAVQRFIAEHRRRYNARMALQRAEQRMASFDMAELRTVVEDWVATAMALSAEERRVLDTLVRMQAADAGAATVTPPIFQKHSA